MGATAELQTRAADARRRLNRAVFAALFALSCRRSPSAAPTGCLAPTSPAAMRWRPTVDEAIRALANPLVREIPNDAQALEVDGDALPDALFWVTGSGCAAGCVVARHTPTGWSAESLSAGAGAGRETVETTACSAPATIAGRTVIVASAVRCWSPENTPSTVFCRRQGAVWAALPREEFRAVYALEGGRQTAWTLRPMPDGNVDLTASGGLPEGVTSPQHLGLAWSADHGRLRPSMCWQARAPEAIPPLLGCSSVASEPYSVRDYEFSTEPTARQNSFHYTRHVVSPGSLRRGDTQMHCVKLTSPLTPEPSFGYVYLSPAQVAGCPEMH